MNPTIAHCMQYRAEFVSGKAEIRSEPGIVKDVYDGEEYRRLVNEKVVVGEQCFNHQYFEDTRDVALGLSTDGFGPFKRRKHTCWPLILFNYNLPPDVRFHLENILALGVIPGPKKPKDADSFLWPFVQEMMRLAIGVKTFDAMAQQMFWLRAYLIVVFGDIPAVSMIMRMVGHNGFSPCRMCKIIGVRIPNSNMTTHYVPHERSAHPMVSVAAAATATGLSDSEIPIKYYHGDKLPLCSHSKMFEQANLVAQAASEAEATRLS